MTTLHKPFYCQECSRKFSTLAAVKRAMSVGCPRCNSGDIQQDKPIKTERAA